MADTLLSAQQVKELIDTGSLDLSEALKLMPQTAYNLLADDLTQAIHSGDMKKINTLLQTAHSQVSPDIYNKLQNTTQKTAYTFQVIKQVQHYQKVAEKKERGEALTEKDNAWLAFRDKLDQQVNKVESYYPQAFAEPTPQNLEVFNVGNEVKQSAARMHWEDEVQSTTGNVSTNDISYRPTENVYAEQPDKKTTVQNDNLENTDVVYSELTPSNNEQTLNVSLPQNQTSGSSEGVEEYIDMYEPSLNPDGLPATLRSGNAYEMSPEAKQERDELTSMQVAPKSKDEKDIQAMNDDAARKMAESGKGYVNSFELDKEDKRSTDWDNVWQQTSKHLQINEKNLDDFCMKLVTGSVLAGIEFLTQWANEKAKSMKEDAKTARQKRLDYIDTNLKSNGMTMNSLASKLARDSKIWILNDPAYAGLPKEGPYTKSQKYLIKKQEFAKSLPRTQEGDIDYAKLSKSQRKQLNSYIEDYAGSPRWQNFVNEATGIAMYTSEMEKMTEQAQGMRVRVDGAELMPQAMTPQANMQSAYQQPMPQQVQGNNGANPLTQPIKDKTPPTPPFRDDNPNTVSPVMPLKTTEMNVPQQTQGADIHVADRANSGNKPVIHQDARTDGNLNFDGTQGIVPPPLVQQKTQETILRTPDQQTLQQGGKQGEQQTAPVTARSEEELKLQKEAEKAITVDKLEELDVSGTLKNPKVVRLADGTTFAVTNENMEDLKRRQETIKRKKEANDDALLKSRDNSRLLSNARSGKEQQTVQAPTQTRQTGMGGRS